MLDSLVTTKNKLINFIKKSAVPGWFEKLSPEKQKEYVSEHETDLRKTRLDNLKKPETTPDFKAPLHKTKEDLQKVLDTTKNKDDTEKKLQAKKRSKTLLNLFDTSEKDLLDAQTVSKYLENKGFEGIDKGFTGLVDKKSIPHTTDGKKISGMLGKNVVMNPKYDVEKDNTYYFSTDLPNGTRAKNYTEDHHTRAGKKKWLTNLEMGQKIGSMREKVDEDLHSEDKRTQMLALLVSLTDKGLFRVGNKGSEKKGVYGLHNLKRKHLTIDGNTAEFNYIGKAKVDRNVKLDLDDHILGLLKEQMENKDDEDYLFSFEHKGKEKLLNDKSINSYMRNRLNSGNVTIHKFRSYHASKQTMEKLSKLDLKDANPTQVKKELMKVVKEVGQSLGHKSSSTTLKYYIDPNIILDFCNKNGVKPPPSIKKASVDSDDAFLMWMMGLPQEIHEEKVHDFGFDE